MKGKKIVILLIGIIIIACASLIYLTTSNEDNNSSNSQDTPIYGETISINGFDCKVGNKYTGGNITIDNSGIQTYGTNNGSIYITVYNNNEEGDNIYNGDISYFAYGESNVDDNPQRQNITVNGHDILYVIQHSDTRGDYRLAFFKVADKRVLIEWVGSEIDNDIKNIINSFYQLNEK